MVHEIRCTCRYNELLFKVIDGYIEVVCRSKECKGNHNTKKRISIRKLLELSDNGKLNELEVNEASSQKVER